MQTLCAQVSPPPVLVLLVALVVVVTGQALSQNWPTSLTHCPSQAVTQQKGSAAQSLVVQGSQALSIAAPLTQSSWQPVGPPPPAPPAPPAPLLPLALDVALDVAPVLVLVPVPVLAPVLVLVVSHGVVVGSHVASHTPPGLQVWPSGQGAAAEQSAQRWALQTLVSAQARRLSSVQVTHLPEVVSQA
jgi:hypothetical protein